MKKNFKRFLSVFLAVLMVTTVIPMGVYAAEAEETEVVQVSELEESRDLYSKTYETSEDTNVVISAAVPLHYEENGELKDIDNTLVKSEEDSSVLTNSANAYNVELPKKYTNDSEIKVDYEDKSISFKLLNDVRSIKGDVTETEKVDVDESDVENVAYAESNMDKLSSAITYENLLPDTDFEYNVQPDALKENIILNKIPDENYTVQYELSTGNLEAILNKDNSISLVDSGKKEVFLIESPYMIDAKDTISEDVAVYLEKSGNDYVLTYTPDYSWLSNEDTIYPVTIDPTIKVLNENLSNTNIEDTYVSSYFNEDINNEFDFVQIQNNEDSGVEYGYYKINNLPNLYNGYNIVKSSFNVFLLSEVEKINDNDNNIALYNSKDNGDIDNLVFSQLNWENKPQISEKIVDIGQHNYQSENIVSFDITSILSTCYENNNESMLFALKSLYESGLIQIAACESNDDLVPFIEIEYKKSSVINDSACCTKDMSFAGVSHINDLTGDCLIERTDFESNGLIDDIVFYYGNSCNLPENQFLGLNTSFNLYKTISKDKINSNYYVLTNGDGSCEYINDESTKYTSFSIDEENGTITVNYNDGADIITETYSSSVLSLNNNKSDIDKIYVLTSCQRNCNGTAQNNSSFRIIYSNSNNRITKIQDNISTYTFSYINYKNMSLLSSIRRQSLISSTSDVLSENKNKSPKSFMCKYEYKDGQSIIYKNYTNTTNFGKKITYNYSNKDKLQITDELGNYYEYTFNNNKVVRVQEFATDGTPGECLAFEYGNNTTIVSDGKDTYTEYFDLAGNLVSIVDQDGNATFAQYSGNLVSKISKTRNSARNITDFYNFEGSKDCFFVTNTGSVEISTEEKFNGNSSVSLISPANKSSFYTGTTKLEKNTTYTVSMWVKSDDASKLELELSNGLPHGIQTSVAANNTSDWQQLSCTISTVNDNNLVIKLTDNRESAVANTVYVDKMYIQKSPYLTNINLLKNGDFSNILNNWNVSDAANTSVSTENANISTADNNRLKLTGDYLSENFVSQTVPITATAKGTKYTYGGWIKTVDPLPTKEGTNREIGLSVYGIASNGTSTLLDKIAYSSYLSNWQYIESELTLPNDNITKLKFVISNNYQTGYAMFDGLSLSQDELYTIEFEYDDNNEIKSIIANGTTVPLLEDESNETESSYNCSYEYDEYGNVIKQSETADIDTVAQKIISNFAYGNNGSLLTKQTNDLGNWINYKYDYFGNTASVIDANGNQIQYEYDNFQNLSSIISQLESSQSSSDFDEDPPANWTEEETKLKVRYSYTGKRLDKIETGNIENDDFIVSNTYAFEYDKWGNVSDVFINDMENPYIHYSYNEKDTPSGKTLYHQMKSVSYTNGQEIHYLYDKDGNIIYEYDSSNKDGKTLAYSYFYYDDGTCYGKKNMITDVAESYQDGITTQRDADGKIIHSYGYNEDGELYEIIGNDTINKSISTEDNNGAITSTQNTNINGVGNIISQTEDPFGRVLTQKVKVGNKYLIKEYTYFTKDELNNSTELNIETTNAVKSIKYFFDDNLNNPIYSFNYTYDDNGNLASETSNNSANNELVKLSYTYNNNMLTKVDSVEGEQESRYDINMIFKYDSQGNMIHWKRDYRSSGNRDWMNIKYSSDNTGTHIDNVVSEFPYSHDTWNISHDEMGNMTSIKQTVEKGYFIDDDCTEYKYNWDRGNILSDTKIYNLPDGNSEAPVLTSSAHYEYDDNNIRTKKTFDDSQHYKNDSESDLKGNVEYFWRDGLLIGEQIEYSGIRMKESKASGESIDNSGTYKINILYDQNNNAYGFILTKSKDAQGNTVNETNTYYYIKDVNNTIIAIIDETGQIKINYENVPYGLGSFETYNFGDNYLGIVSPLQYRDYIFDHESDMYYLQSRYYNPLLCRFISADNVLDTSSGNAMSTNLYSYCENDPINNIDPYGTFAIPRDVLSIALDIAFDVLIPAAAGSVNVIGRSIQAMMKGSKTVAKVAKVVSKLKSGYVTRVKGIYSTFYTAIRRGIARATGYTISTSFGLAVQKTFSTIVNKLTNSKFKDQVDIITCFFSLGGWIALLIDATDGSLNRDCKLW